MKIDPAGRLDDGPRRPAGRGLVRRLTTDTLLCLPARAHRRASACKSKQPSKQAGQNRRRWRLACSTVGIRSALGMVEAAATYPATVGNVAASEGALRELDPVAAAAFGISTDSSTITREQAMRVPAVRRGRSLIAGTIGTLPLVAYRTSATGAVTPVRRRLLDQLDPSTTPAYTITWTVDDLLFRGVSWWRVTDRDATGYPVAVERLAPSRVSILTTRAGDRVHVDGRVVDDSDLIRFDGPDEGVLSYGAPSINLALSLQRAARRTADDDVPSMILRLAEGAPELSQAEVDELLDSWEAARRQRTTAYLNRAVDPEAVAYDAQRRQLSELSQMVSSELARLMNLPASRIGAPQGSGMTYANTEADRRDLVDTTLALYLTPLWQRLSMPDVTPAGQAVAVDLSAYLRGTTSELVAAGVQALDAGVITRTELRTRWLGLAPDDNREGDA